MSGGELLRGPKSKTTNFGFGPKLTSSRFQPHGSVPTKIERISIEVVGAEAQGLQSNAATASKMAIGFANGRNQPPDARFGRRTHFKIVVAILKGFGGLTSDRQQ